MATSFWSFLGISIIMIIKPVLDTAVTIWSALFGGTRMCMVFRVREYDEARGFRKYFWKATPVG